MDITQFDYERPQLVDFNIVTVKGDDASCYVDCASDDICPDTSDLV